LIETKVNESLWYCITGWAHTLGKDDGCPHLIRLFVLKSRVGDAAPKRSWWRYRVLLCRIIISISISNQHEYLVVDQVENSEHVIGEDAEIFDWKRSNKTASLQSDSEMRRGRG
jgi:hypothetical protein